jgi:hypothetical protein
VSFKLEDPEKTKRQKIKDDALEFAQLIYDIFMENEFDSSENQEKAKVEANA